MTTPRLLFLDFETYYASDYTLRDLTPAEYILDPRFETIMLSAAEGWDGKTVVIDGPDVPEFLAGYDPAVTVTVTWNALFDNAILAWRYGWVPFRMIDAMNVAGALRGHQLKNRKLATVAKFMKVGDKGGEIVNVQGMRREDIIRVGRWQSFSDYCIQDTHLMREISRQLFPEMPESEFRVMDLVLRCAIQPRFIADKPLLLQHLEETMAHKRQLLDSCGVDKADLMSTSKFKQLIEARGIVVGTKTSKSTGMEIPALAKTDDFMQSLVEHDDPEVQALACARLGHKSTLEETRTARLLKISILPWDKLPCGNPRLYSGGDMPIPLRYGAAHTHRLGGDWGINMQNLPKEWLNPATGKKETGRLRRALRAPPNHVIIDCDLKQIEARLTAWFCKCLDLMQQFERGEDPYATLASSIFGYPVDRKVHKVEGFIGKSGILGLGFGAGAAKFFDMVIKSARAMGLDISTIGWSLALAHKTVQTYRTKYWPMPAMWHDLDDILSSAWVGRSGPVNLGPVTISTGRVDLPNGLALLYDNPEVTATKKTYTFGHRTHYIYGSAFLENIIQALARIILTNAALRLDCRGYRFALQLHDALTFIVHKDDVDTARGIIHTEMTRRPAWARDLALDVDIKLGTSYGDAR